MLGLVGAPLVLATSPAFALSDTAADAADERATAAGNGECGGAKTSIITCDQKDGKELKDNGIWGLLLIAINVMSAGVGVLAVGGIVYASIRIASAGDNAANVKKGVNMIINTVVGVLGYIAMYAFLQYLIPGGIFT